ncbi:MAG: hypothetical protein QXP01_07800 [Candidatus Hadarchaeum sp.]
MSDQHPSLFRTPEEELAHLGRQLAEIREALRDISARISLIERHVKRAFGVSRLPGTSAPGASRSAKQPGDTPSFPPEQARPIFEELIQTWCESSPDDARARLDAMSAPDLKLLAHELGLSLPKKPSRKALVSALIGRINESILLSANRTRESLHLGSADLSGPPLNSAETKVPASSSQREAEVSAWSSHSDPPVPQLASLTSEAALHGEEASQPPPVQGRESS